MLPPLAHNSKGEFRQITFSPPITLQIGDKVDQIGNQIVVTRASVVVATRTLSGIGSLVDGPAQASQSVSSVLYFRSYPVIGQNVSMTRVTENTSTGVVTLWYSNGNSTEYADWESVGAVANSIDSDPEMAQKLLAMKAYRASPDGSNKTTQVGASISVNGLADIPVVYTEPQ